MNSSHPRLQLILLAIFVIALLGLGALVLSGASFKNLAGGSTDKNSTTQAETSSLNCSVTVIAPEYTPKHFYPPSIIVYDSRPFLITWTVINTSESCVWSSLQLRTVVDGEERSLVMMPSIRSQPLTDQEFVMRDKDDLPVTQVAPRQKVTITVQINGLDLVASNGKIDRSFDMIINGRTVDGGTLIAQQSQWVVLLLPSETPTITSTPSKTPTATLTGTATKTTTPTVTLTPVASWTWRPTISPTDTSAPPIIRPPNTSTPIPPTAPPPPTETLPLPPP